MGAYLVIITGLQNFTNLIDFNADYNSIESIDFSGMSGIQTIDVSDCFETSGDRNNSLTSINVSGCTSLKELRIDDSNFLGQMPDLRGLTSLEFFDADDSSISGVVDLSFLPALKGFDLSWNSGITSVIISSSQPLGQDGDSISIYDCSLTQESVDNILVTLSNNGISNGSCVLSGSGNASPSAIGLAAKAVLEGRGWYVEVN